MIEMAGASADCIFCKIIAGRIPASRVADSAESIIFLDAFPAAHGHCLVAPKKHYGLLQDVPPSTSADMMQLAARAVSRMEEKLGCSTLVALHNGKDAGQEIPHVHLHLIPRRPGDGAGAVTRLFPEPARSPGDVAKLLELVWKEPL